MVSIDRKNRERLRFVRPVWFDLHTVWHLEADTSGISNSGRPSLQGLAVWLALLAIATVLAGSFYFFRPRIADPGTEYEQSA